MKKSSILSLALALALSLSACGGGGAATAETRAPTVQPSQAEPVELVVFAAASLTESLNQIAGDYRAAVPNVTLTFNFDSSGTLKTQIEEGADCDLFLSAAQKQMDQLDAAADGAVNSGGPDFVLQGTRVDLLENKVVLVVPRGNPAGVASFEDVGADRVELVALGNSDVPVGQYAQEIFTAMGLWEELNAGQKITFGANVKEVTAQVSEGAVDCGVVYATDANSAGLEIAAAAPQGTHSPVVYPAAVLSTTEHEAEARAFLDYLQGADAAAVFASAGFSVPG